MDCYSRLILFLVYILEIREKRDKFIISRMKYSKSNKKIIKYTNELSDFDLPNILFN